MARNAIKIKIGSDELSRCGPGIHRILLMKKKKIIQAIKKDKNRIKETLVRLKKEEEKEIRVLAHPVFSPLIIGGRFCRRSIKIRAILDFAGNSYDLHKMGIKVHSHNHNYFTIIATKKQLEELITQPATRQIRLPRLFLPYLKDAIPTAEIDQIHIQGTKGNGVIVSIIDTILHVEHHAFRDPNNPDNTRVMYMWVQDPDDANAAGQNPEAYYLDNTNHPNSPDFSDLNYGRIYDAATINLAIVSGTPYGSGINQISKEPPPYDGLDRCYGEHGTHVAGIAAGSGHFDDWLVTPENVGAAPLADIVYVCRRFSSANIQSGVLEDDTINALNFVLKVASQNGQAVVINNSYGSSCGPHNGNTIFDQTRNTMLDSYLGRSLVFAVANDNKSDGFRKGSVPVGLIETFNMVTRGDGALWLDIWYNGSDLDFKIDCGTGSTDWVVSSNDFLGNVDSYYIEVNRDYEQYSGMKAVRIYIQAALNGITWTIHLRSNSSSNVNYWAWVGVLGDWARLDGSSQGELTLGDTACARSILSVGACVKSEAGNPEIIADYSGRGPTIDGRIKPEIVTVGGVTANKIQSDDSMTTGGYCGKQGTSMAAPIVSGGIALLFENNLNLNQDEIKALLIQTANRINLDIDQDAPGFDQLERNAYGFGRLRMLTPFEHSLPLTNVDVWVRTADDDYGFEPYPGGCFCHAPEIKVIDSNGNEATTLNWGQEHTVQVKIHNLGDNDAADTVVKLKYTRPWLAPNEWVQCQDSDNNPIEERVDISALNYNDFEFNQKWKPESGELPPDGTGWGDHYCLLVELDHPNDPLLYHDAAAGGSDPWTKNIKGTNNVALLNLHIQ